MPFYRIRRPPVLPPKQLPSDKVGDNGTRHTQRQPRTPASVETARTEDALGPKLEASLRLRDEVMDTPPAMRRKPVDYALPSPTPKLPTRLPPVPPKTPIARAFVRMPSLPARADSTDFVSLPPAKRAGPAARRDPQIDQGDFVRLFRDAHNAEVYDELVRRSRGKVPMVLQTRHDTYLTVATGMQGGFGEILLAIDQRGNLRAIKQMRSEAEVMALGRTHRGSPVRATPLAVAEREANLTQVLAPGLHAQNLIETPYGRTYMVMDFMPICGLDAFEQAPQASQPELALLLLRNAAEKLEFVHAQGFVHRDVKLENILIGRDGRAEISDFGLATADSPPGIAVGTYIPPEILMQGGEYTAAADVYALCASVVAAFDRGAGRSPCLIHGGPKGFSVMQRNSEDVEFYRDFVLFGARLPRRARHVALAFAPIAEQAPSLHRLLIEHGMNPDPAARMTMSQIVSATTDLAFNAPRRDAAKQHMLDAIQLPLNVASQQTALTLLHQLETSRS